LQGCGFAIWFLATMSALRAGLFASCGNVAWLAWIVVFLVGALGIVKLIRRAWEALFDD
jgi:hypothetical protein